MRISDWSSDVCSSDLEIDRRRALAPDRGELRQRAGRGIAAAGRCVRARQRGVDIHRQRIGTLARGGDAFGVARIGVRHERLVGAVAIGLGPALARSEEHTSELQSLMRISYAVFCLKKTKLTQMTATITNVTERKTKTKHT